eukprot:TRINITY_DN4183_c0_g1_i1.p1 TRINITY_DN4183_c0_g1~~TRINITY_DN4183_c0_g1_i1.p1  ORF type:complete len:425 (-),score=90.60 TRINITY_DN4183_c0_g1_i1:325-1599(-)
MSLNHQRKSNFSTSFKTVKKVVVLTEAHLKIFWNSFKLYGPDWENIEGVFHQENVYLDVDVILQFYERNKEVFSSSSLSLVQLKSSQDDFVGFLDAYEIPYEYSDVYVKSGESDPMNTSIEENLSDLDDEDAVYNLLSLRGRDFSREDVYARESDNTFPIENVPHNQQIWSIYEWFYSNVDHPWFNENEFQICLNQLNLSHIKLLRSIEWKYVRGCIYRKIGKPRRFSQKFIEEEKEKLQEYRTLKRESNYLTDQAVGSEADRVLAIHPVKNIPYPGVSVGLSNRSRYQMYKIKFIGESQPREIMDLHVSSLHQPADEIHLDFSKYVPSLRSMLHPPKEDSKIQGEMSIYSVYTREDIQNYCKLTSLLRKKNHLQQELIQLTEHAKNASLTGEDKKLCAWIIIELHGINDEIKVIDCDTITPRN